MAIIDPFAPKQKPESGIIDPFAPKAPTGIIDPFAPKQETTSVVNPFAQEGAVAAPEVEKSSLWEFPKRLVGGAIELKGMYAGVKQRQAALGMAAPEAAMQAFDKIDAGEIKDKAGLSKLIGGERKLPSAEEIFEGEGRRPGATVRAFGLAKDYLAASPEQRKALRAQLQAELTESGKSVAEAYELGQEAKRQAAPYEARVKSIFDAENTADVLSYFGGLSGQALPQVVPMVAAGILTRGRTIGPASVGTAMELGAGTQNRVDFIADKIKAESDPDKRVKLISDYIQKTADVTLTAAIVNGALDAVLGPEKDIAKALLARSLKDLTRKEIIKQIPKAAAKSGAQEFLTGGLQEIVQINAERKLGEQTGDALTKENIKRVVDSALAEAVGGATITTGFQAGRAALTKPEVTPTSAEGRAIADLDTLADKEDAAAAKVAAEGKPAARTLEDLTEAEVGTIQRQLFAQYGRPATYEELEGAFNDYLAEQNASAGIEPGADVAGVPSDRVAEAAGVPDTGLPPTPEAGGLADVGKPAESVTAREGVQPATLEEATDAYEEAEATRDEARREVERLQSAVEEIGYEGSREDVAELNRMLTEAEARYEEARLAAEDAFQNYTDLAEQELGISTEGIPSEEEVAAAAPKAEEVIEEAPEAEPPSEGGVFKSISRSLATAVSPLVGMLPVNKFGINRLNKLYNDGKISAEEYAERMTKLYADMEDKAAMKSMTQGLKRERGFGTVVKALEDAAKKGRISAETANFAKWLLTRNPAIANDLAISISMPKSARAKESMEGVAGFYNDMAKLVRLITKKDPATGKYYGTDPLVAVHEILHHMERMLPNEFRALIRNEWRVQLKKAMSKADKDGNQNLIKYLALVAHGNATQSSAALSAAENMIKDGTVDQTYYSLMNPSEFWAVNASDILYDRYGARTKFDKLRQYFKEFIEAIKNVFGLESNDPIIKGLNAVLKGEGTFVQKQMLSEGVGTLYPSLSPEGWTSAETEISEEEKKLQEQFRRAGNLRPDVIEAIRNNDLNGALNILAKRLGGFYGELATKLASLNLETSIAFDNAPDLAQRFINETVGPQLQRVMNYIRVANPDFYERYFKDFDNPANITAVTNGLNILHYNTVVATQGVPKYKYPEIFNELKDTYGAYIKMRDMLTVPGAYLNLFDTITLNTKEMEGIGNRVLLHEVVHAATVSILRADPSQLTKEQLEAREEIERLYKLAQQNAKVGEYGLTNKFEFLAELFTNDGFRNQLKKVPYPPARTNILSRFFNAILRLVGADNLASRSMVEAEKLFTATRYQETKPMGPLFAQGKRTRKPRGPISTPDTYRTATDQQNMFLQTMKDAYEGRMEWKDAIKILGPALWDSKNTLLRNTTLPVMNLTHLEDLTRTKFTQLTGALKIIRDMVAYRAKKMNTAGEILADWTKLQKKNFAQSQLMGRIMLEATIRGRDPDTKLPPGVAPDALDKAWNTLKPEYKEVYRKVRNFYSDSVKQMVQEMERRADAIPDPAARAAMLKKINDQFGPDKLVKPYFPLRRFGQYWFQVGSGNFKEFYEFESPLSRDIAMRRRMRELSRGNAQQKQLAQTIAKGNGISELYGRNIGTTQVLKDVQELVDGVSATDIADLKNQLQDSLNQLIYLLLPQQSMRKMFINRKAIQGASADMLRVFATTSVHSAYQQSRFMFAEKFLQNLNNARSEIDDAQKLGMLSTDTAASYKDFILEVEKRVPTVMSNEDTSFTAQVAGKASELTFYYMLSAPFTAVLNTIGAVQLAMPYIGGTYGYTKANAKLIQNMGRYLSTSPKRTFMPLAKGAVAQVNFPSIVEGANLSPLLKRAADRFVDDGVVDISLTNDIFELGDRPSALYTGTAATIKKIMSGLFHQSERMNREILLLTTFELAHEKFLKDYQRQPGMEGLRGVYLRDAQGNKIKNTPDQAFELAIEEATRVAALTLGDYSRQMKGRIFSNPIANLLLKFKQYPILALFAVYRNLQMGFIEPFKKAELNQYRALLEKELANDPNKDQTIAQRMEEVEAQRKALSKEARRRLAGILGVSMILGGQAAMPYFSLVIGTLAQMFAGDDDDDYFDWENWFYNYMETEFGGYLGAMLANTGVKPEAAEKMGRTGAEIVARGVPSAMGAAIADRVSLDPKALLWRDGRFSPDAREGFIESMIANAGPVVGLGLNFADAYQLAKEGQYGRAAEKALPAIVSKPMAAIRMKEEGAKTKGGDTLVNDFTMTELAMQSIGLQPERLAQKQKAAAAMKLKEQKIKAERSAIMDRLWMERDNPDAFDTAIERATKFSEKHPALAITTKSIQNSFKKRAQAAAEAEAFGARIDKKLRGELMEMGEFAEDEE